MKMRYNLQQVMDAAGFIWHFNDSVTEWPDQPKSAMDVVSIILDFARKRGMENMAGDEWTSWSGTGGFMIIFTSDDDESFAVEVYVDPALINPRRFVEEWIDEEEF